MSEETIAAEATTVKVGDEVEYVPHDCHAQNRSKSNGEYPWVIGLKRVRVDASKTPPARETYVQELTDAEAVQYFTWLRRCHPETREKEKNNLIFLRPKKPWKAKVTAVHGGFVDLSIESNQGGVTLHYANIPLDHKGATPHSWRHKVPKLPE